MPEDKRTRIGPTGPVRPVTTGTGRVAASATPAPGATNDATSDVTSDATTSTAAAPPATPASSPDTWHGDTPRDPLLGQTLAGRYLIQQKLGEGGMGGVYLATHNVLEKQVALKVLHRELAAKPDLVSRFMQEAKAASRIRHENVIDISDFGTTPEGLVFFAMDLLKGRDLHEEITRARLAAQLLPWPRSKRIFLQICAALGAAHALGIIHRDLKPENIYLVEFLGEPDFVKLLDFGLAKLTEVPEGDRKLTRTGMLFGTPEYMSPEQARGEPVDHRVDVYAMGCILYQLVTGRVPFEAPSFMGVLTLHLTAPPPAVPPEVLDSIGAPRGLAAVIDRALAKDRDERFASIDELARAIRQLSGDPATEAAVAPPGVAAPSEPAAAARARRPWTGMPSIAQDATVAPRSSRPWLISGAVVLVAGATAYLATRGSGAADGGGPARATAAAGVAARSPAPDTPAAPPPVVARPPAAPPLAFAWAQIRLDSIPAGADVKDLASGKVIGHTPFPFKLRPSRAARQFELHHADYVDAVVEVVPDRETIDHTEKLARGTGRPATGKPGPTRPAQPDGTPTRPEPAVAEPAAGPARPASAPAAPVKPVDDDCEPPCLKADPSRAGQAGSSTP